MIEVLRLGHRISRDKRISTHVALVARTFGASRLYYTGQKDGEMESSVCKIVSKFGGDFSVEHVKDFKKLFLGKKIVHLTMYGDDFSKYVGKIKGNVLVVVGGEKVPGEIYSLSDYNLGVGNQPHSEVAALAVFLDHFNKFKFPKFKGKLNVVPNIKGKKIFKKE
ncbi:tRNA (cytidine(56)-2'-O)-methyltransferase [Candidatus Woesearchaeota archaeon]|jgi:tRNA (cytidine56-2'-O)-methyltransferase|nr:tRNA (cytidine(56)-2'-O)-methyltransferase [Candidatus Woesearchaeota archaeon]MBT4322126.1 tRNA (cytidine(56)-2'-O)-methyltransferase [Candidatus Woesearchaeota archaeon]MBT4630703.1 tRNA (cytidine(56)-2'-O)-methyltransferase [Candidatus Woesearchaeota archaeon]